jgi:hypothetical protein
VLLSFLTWGQSSRPLPNGGTYCRCNAKIFVPVVPLRVAWPAESSISPLANIRPPLCHLLSPPSSLSLSLFLSSAGALGRPGRWGLHLAGAAQRLLAAIEEEAPPRARPPELQDRPRWPRPGRPPRFDRRISRMVLASCKCVFLCLPISCSISRARAQLYPDRTRLFPQHPYFSRSLSYLFLLSFSPSLLPSPSLSFSLYLSLPLSICLSPSPSLSLSRPISPILSPSLSLPLSLSLSLPALYLSFSLFLSPPLSLSPALLPCPSRPRSF